MTNPARGLGFAMLLRRLLFGGLQVAIVGRHDRSRPFLVQLVHADGSPRRTLFRALLRLEAKKLRDAHPGTTPCAPNMRSGGLTIKKSDGFREVAPTACFVFVPSRLRVKQKLSYTPSSKFQYGSGGTIWNNHIRNPTPARPRTQRPPPG